MEFEDQVREMLIEFRCRLNRSPTKCERAALIEYLACGVDMADAVSLIEEIDKVYTR